MVVGAATEYGAGLGATSGTGTGLKATIGTVVRAEETTGPITEVGAAAGPVTLSSELETFSYPLLSVLNSTDQGAVGIGQAPARGSHCCLSTIARVMTHLLQTVCQFFWILHMFWTAVPKHCWCPLFRGPANILPHSLTLQQGTSLGCIDKELVKCKQNQKQIQETQR